MAPRLTSALGQNLSFLGGLQAVMIPALATASIELSYRDPSSSTNRPDPAIDARRQRHREQPGPDEDREPGPAQAGSAEGRHRA